MNTLLDTLQYFAFITIELIVLFMAISALVEIILMYIPAEKIQKSLSGKGIMGNILRCWIWGIDSVLCLFHYSDDRWFSQCRCTVRLGNVVSDFFATAQSYYYRNVGSIGRN